MSPLLIAGIIAAAAVVILFVWSLCRAAGTADRRMDDMRREEGLPAAYTEPDFDEPSISIPTSFSKDEDTMPETIGTPIFMDAAPEFMSDGGDVGGRKPCVNLSQSQSVWVLGPTGPIKMAVTEINGDEATLQNDEFEAKVIRKPNYFSQSVANKLGIEKQAWCLDDIRRRNETEWYRRNRGSSIRYGSRAGGLNVEWLEEYSIFDMFFDITLEFFLILADEMYHEFDYYQDNFPCDEQVDQDAAAVMEMEEQVNVAAEQQSAPEDDYQAPGPAHNMEEPASEPPSVDDDSRRFSPPVETHYEPPADTGGYGGGDSGGGDFGGGGFDD